MKKRPAHALDALSLSWPTFPHAGASQYQAYSTPIIAEHYGVAHFHATNTNRRHNIEQVYTL